MGHLQLALNARREQNEETKWTCAQRKSFDWMNTTSPSLLERLRQPAEQDAWARFVKLYTPLLYFWAHRLGLAESDAADLVQDDLYDAGSEIARVSLPNPSKSFRGCGSGWSCTTSGVTTSAASRCRSRRKSRQQSWPHCPLPRRSPLAKRSIGSTW